MVAQYLAWKFKSQVSRKKHQDQIAGRTRGITPRHLLLSRVSLAVYCYQRHVVIQDAKASPGRPAAGSEYWGRLHFAFHGPSGSLQLPGCHLRNRLPLPECWHLPQVPQHACSPAGGVTVSNRNVKTSNVKDSIRNPTKKRQQYLCRM